MNYLFLFVLLKSSDLPFCIHCKINDVVEISNLYYDYKVFHIIRSEYAIELRDYNNYNKLIAKFEIIDSLGDILNQIVTILKSNHYENRVVFLLNNMMSTKSCSQNNDINNFRYLNFLQYNSLRRCLGFLNGTTNTKDLILFLNFVKILDFFWNLEQSDYLGFLNDLTQRYDDCEQFTSWIEKNCTVKKILKFIKHSLITKNGYLYFNQNLVEIDLKKYLIGIFDSDIKDIVKCTKVIQSLFRDFSTDEIFQFDISIFNRIIFSDNTHLITYFNRKKQFEDILVKVKNQRIYLEIVCKEIDKIYFIEVLTGFCNLESDKYYKSIYDLFSEYENFIILTKKLDDLSLYYSKEPDKEYIDSFIEFLSSLKIFEIENFYKFIMEILFNIEKDILHSLLQENITDIILQNILSNLNNINIFDVRDNKNNNFFIDSDIDNIIFVILKKCRYLKETKDFHYLVCWIYFTIINEEKYNRLLRFYSDIEIVDLRTYFQQDSKKACSKLNLNVYKNNLLYNVRKDLNLSPE